MNFSLLKIDCIFLTNIFLTIVNQNKFSFIVEDQYVFWFNFMLFELITIIFCNLYGYFIILKIDMINHLKINFISLILMLL